jgi:hypothetical protein
MRDIKINRPTLGDFMHVVCFRYLSDDAEESAGRALVVDAGRQRGHDVMEELGVVGKHQAAADIMAELNDALGINGTKLCIINSMEEHDDGGFEVHAVEVICPNYTLGVMIGAISAATGTKMLGKQQSEGDESKIVYHIYPFS